MRALHPTSLSMQFEPAGLRRRWTCIRAYVDGNNVRQASGTASFEQVLHQASETQSRRNRA
jgi:hypothetical protein